MPQSRKWNSNIPVLNWGQLYCGKLSLIQQLKTFLLPIAASHCFWFSIHRADNCKMCEEIYNNTQTPLCMGHICEISLLVHINFHPSLSLSLLFFCACQIQSPAIPILIPYRRIYICQAWESKWEKKLSHWVFFGSFSLSIFFSLLLLHFSLFFILFQLTSIFITSYLPLSLFLLFF